MERTKRSISISMKTLQQLKERIVDISYKHKLSHLSSCLTTIEILHDVAHTMRPQDIIVLSNGHAGLALYVILEELYGHNAEKLFLKHGVHPNRDLDNHIVVSTGSLGHGIGIGLGIAKATPRKGVYIVCSDGELAEGSVYEAIRFLSENDMKNVFLTVNYNGYGAYRATNVDHITKLLSFLPKDRYALYYLANPPFPYLEGQEGHYHILTEDEYKEVVTFYRKQS